MTLNRKSGTFDALVEFKDSGLVGASAAATVGGVAQIVDMGTGVVEANMILDVSAVEVASSDEIYTVIVQGSNSSAFADTIVPLAKMEIGVAVANQKSDDDEVGRYVLPFRNERNGTNYRYLRVYTAVAGTVATGINFVAYAVPKN